MKVYDPHGGKDNLRRLTGRHETSRADQFSWGVANRGCSVRIPRQVALDKKVIFQFYLSINIFSSFYAEVHACSRIRYF